MFLLFLLLSTCSMPPVTDGLTHGSDVFHQWAAFVACAPGEGPVVWVREDYIETWTEADSPLRRHEMKHIERVHKLGGCGPYIEWVSKAHNWLLAEAEAHCAEAEWWIEKRGFSPIAAFEQEVGRLSGRKDTDITRVEAAALMRLYCNPSVEGEMIYGREDTQAQKGRADPTGNRP